MTSSQSTVADVIEYDPENKALALNMIEEILEIRQGVLPEVKRKMEVNFYFHCNIGEGHGLQSKEEIEKLLMRPSYCCLSLEEQETINLRNAYSYLMSHCDENQGLLEESMLRETNRIILRNIARFRRKRIKRKLLKVSAKEIARHIFCLVRENCEGCITIHLSQTHHECLSMGKFKRLEYFDAALQRILEATVMKMFTESLNAMDLSIYTEHPVKDWKSVFCKEILKIL